MDRWRGPEYDGEFPSLGWDLLEWYQEYLTVPSGPFVGQPLVLTDEQASFVVRFYRIDPVTGERDKRRAVLRRPKGWGKSPLLAAMAIGELCGPVVFDGWKDGEPLARAHRSPWVQIAACSEDQTDNTYVALFEMLRDSPAVEEFGLDVGLTRVFLKGRPGRLEPVTASSGSREGQPVTFAVLDETHLWTQSNGGRKLAATVRRNVAKMGGTSVESTNAYVPGAGSVAEASEAAKGKGQKGLLLDVGDTTKVTIEDLANREKALRLLALKYGDSRWVDLERIYSDATDADTSPEDALRFYFNMIVQSSDQAFDVKLWASLADAKIIVPDKSVITLGFDGSRRDDATGIVATHVETGHMWNAGLWEKQPNDTDDWEVPVLEVTETLEMLFDRYDVWRLYADPWYWETQVHAEWPAKFGAEKVIEWDTRSPKKMAYALKSFVNAMRAQELSHDGDSDLARHIANSRRRDTQRMRDEEGRLLWVIQKEHPSSPNKMDLAMASVLSWEARNDCVAAGGSGAQDNRAVFL